MSWPKTCDEMKESERLCSYCPLPEELQGVHCYGGQPVMCEGSHCGEAYERYLEEVEANDGWPDDCEECPVADSSGECTCKNQSDGSSPCDVMTYKDWEGLEKEGCWRD